MKISNLKTGVKISMSFIIVVLAFVSISLFQLFEMSSLKDLEDVEAKRAKDAIEVKDIEMHVDEFYALVADAIINRNIRATEIELGKQKGEILKAMELLENLADTKEEKELGNQIKTDFNVYIAIFEQELLPDFRNGIFNMEKIRPIDARLDDIRDKLDENLTKYVTSLVRENDAISAHFDETFETTYKITIAIILVGVLFASLFAFIITRYIVARIRESMDLAGKLAEGDFTVRMNSTTKDEFGILSGTLDKSADGLENLVTEIMVAAQNLTQAVQEISSGNENLSQRTSEQASSLEEVASTIEEATASIRQNAQNAVDANNNAQETGRVVQKAKEVSNKAITLAEEGGKIVVDAVASIEEVNRSSQKITEILGVINEIAFQTNLLALNAAVEAARAGEQGRGFAVVAGEVRNLAQRSAGASKEIGDMIKESIRKVEAGTTMVNRSGEALRKIIESVKENGDSLDGVIMAVQNVTQLISEIAAASEEQKRGTDQINIAVSELDTMTQQNAALVEQTASASEEMASQAREMLAMVERFEVREDLKKKVYDTKHKEVHLQQARKPALENKTGAAVKSRKVNGKVDGAELKKVMTEDGFDEF